MRERGEREREREPCTQFVVFIAQSRIGVGSGGWDGDLGKTGINYTVKFMITETEIHDVTGWKEK